MRTIFANGKIITSTGTIIENGYCVVSSGAIDAVESGPAPVPSADDNIVDCSGKTVMPGLVDTHIHCVGGDYFAGFQDDGAGLVALRTVEAMRKTLNAGITTVRTAGWSKDYIDIDIRDAISEGLVEGPTIIASGRGITCTGGHLAPVAVEADGETELRKAVRSHAHRGANSIKLMLSAGVATAGLAMHSLQFTDDEARVVVDEAHKLGMRVLSHCQGYRAVNQAISIGVDSVDHGDGLDDAAAEKMVAKGIYLTPTFCPRYYYTKVRKAEEWRIKRAESDAGQREAAFAVALKHGVSLTMGSDCGGQSRMPNGANALEVQLMVKNGLSAHDAIIASTSNGAQAVGRLEVGTIETGKAADIIVIDGDPLDDISLLRTHVDTVMKNGKIVRSAS